MFVTTGWTDITSQAVAVFALSILSPGSRQALTTHKKYQEQVQKKMSSSSFSSDNVSASLFAA